MEVNERTRSKTCVIFSTSLVFRVVLAVCGIIGLRGVLGKDRNGEKVGNTGVGHNGGVHDVGGWRLG